MLNFEMPEDVRKFVLKIQKELKEKKKMKLYSQQLTICHIIREHKKNIECGNMPMQMVYAKGEIQVKINNLAGKLGIKSAKLSKVIKSGLKKDRKNKKNDIPPNDDLLNN